MRWQPVPQTWPTHSALVDDTGKIWRLIVPRTPDMGEPTPPGGLYYVVTGDGHEMSRHETHEEAQAAAEASLPGAVS